MVSKTRLLKAIRSNKKDLTCPSCQQKLCWKSHPPHHRSPAIHPYECRTPGCSFVLTSMLPARKRAIENYADAPAQNKKGPPQVTPHEVNGSIHPTPVVPETQPEASDLQVNGAMPSEASEASAIEENEEPASDSVQFVQVLPKTPEASERHKSPGASTNTEETYGTSSEVNAAPVSPTPPQGPSPQDMVNQDAAAPETPEIGASFYTDPVASPAELLGLEDPDTDEDDDDDEDEPDLAFFFGKLSELGQSSPHTGCALSVLPRALRAIVTDNTLETSPPPVVQDSHSDDVAPVRDVNGAQNYGQNSGGLYNDGVRNVDEELEALICHEELMDTDPEFAPASPYGVQDFDDIFPELYSPADSAITESEDLEEQENDLSFFYELCDQLGSPLDP